jgi:para-aminobenzoate synthetase / 4-amino-4-deoxychorismate lyase
MSNPLVFLDDARPGRERLSLFANLEGVIEARAPDDVEAALAALDGARWQGLHAAGYLSYELGYLLEPKLENHLPAQRSVPLLWFGLFRSREDFMGAESGRWLEKKTRSRAYASPMRYGETPGSYAEKFSRVANYIGAGDVYQVNLTFPARFNFAGDPLALYRRLRGRTQAGHGAYIFDGRRSIVSFSPELFFRVENGRLTARPMKGTAARGRDADEDALARAALAASRKDRAENLMIVDLIRNDAGRVAKLGTVKALDMFEVETYPTVHQMVSTVTAELREGVAPSDLLRALFPCGSVTGAPKIRAMEIIRELEAGPRGIYCGAIGCFSADGTAQFNVSIRTLTIDGSEGVLGIGGGIVADSSAAAEYAECLVKARYYGEDRPPISLIETLRHEPGAGFVRGELHLARLARSARILGLHFDPEQISRRMVERASEEIGPSRVRLELFEDGTFNVEARGLAQGSHSAWTYVVSEQRVPSGDALARHKTSWRAIYDEEYARQRALTGCDQVIFLNERGEVAEGNVANVFVRRDGRLLTPPLSAGALDGCLRSALLASGDCEEAVLYPADLEQGEAYLGNSLRGLVRALPVYQTGRILPPVRSMM